MILRKLKLGNAESVEDETLVVKADANKASKPEASADVSSLVDEKVAIQAEKISEIINPDRKIKFLLM